MCLATVYIEDTGELKLAMAKVAKLENQNNAVICRDFLGRTQRISGKIVSIDLENNCIICKAEE